MKYFIKIHQLFDFFFFFGHLLEYLKTEKVA